MKKRFSILLLAIGLLAVSVATAKDREPVSVSVSDSGNSAGYDSIHSSLNYIYVTEVTNEVVIPNYADELVKPVLSGFKMDVFHPPANRNRHI